MLSSLEWMNMEGSGFALAHVSTLAQKAASQIALVQIYVKESGQTEDLTMAKN